jgi:hypothetical protein
VVSAKLVGVGFQERQNLFANRLERAESARICELIRVVEADARFVFFAFAFIR